MDRVHFLDDRIEWNKFRRRLLGEGADYDDIVDVFENYDTDKDYAISQGELQRMIAHVTTHHTLDNPVIDRLETNYIKVGKKYGFVPRFDLSDIMERLESIDEHIPDIEEQLAQISTQLGQLDTPKREVVQKQEQAPPPESTKPTQPSPIKPTKPPPPPPKRSPSKSKSTISKSDKKETSNQPVENNSKSTTAPPPPPPKTSSSTTKSTLVTETKPADKVTSSKKPSTDDNQKGAKPQKDETSKKLDKNENKPLVTETSKTPNPRSGQNIQVEQSEESEDDTYYDGSDYYYYFSD